MREFVLANQELCASALAGHGKDAVVKMIRDKYGYSDRDDSFVMNELLSSCQMLGIKPKRKAPVERERYKKDIPRVETFREGKHSH